MSLSLSLSHVCLVPSTPRPLLLLLILAEGPKLLGGVMGVLRPLLDRHLLAQGREDRVLDGLGLEERLGRFQTPEGTLYNLLDTLRSV